MGVLGEAPQISVTVHSQQVRLAAGPCIECGRPAHFNLAVGVVLHDDQAGHDACPIIVTQRAFGRLMAEAAEQLDRLVLNVGEKVGG